MDQTPTERILRIAALLALTESPGLEGDALEMRIHELLELGEDRMREIARSLPRYQLR